jgi:hypothetical protein
MFGDALSTMRIVTYRDDGAPARLVRACLKIPRTGSDVDNLHAGGWAAAVDGSGVLGRARAMLPSGGEYAIHPDTGARIDGAQLSEYDSAVALALRAHETLNVPWSVGWDVAMTPDGPILLEGNPLWSADLAQIPQGEPLPDEFTARLIALTPHQTEPRNNSR